MHEITRRVPFEALDDNLLDMHCEGKSEDARSNDDVSQSVAIVTSLA